MRWEAQRLLPDVKMLQRIAGTQLQEIRLSSTRGMPKKSPVSPGHQMTTRSFRAVETRLFSYGMHVWARLSAPIAVIRKKYIQWRGRPVENSSLLLVRIRLCASGM